MYLFTHLFLQTYVYELTYRDYRKEFLLSLFHFSPIKVKPQVAFFPAEWKIRSAKTLAPFQPRLSQTL